MAESTMEHEHWFSRIQWQRVLSWALFIFVVYELRDFFFVAFVTFLLCYLVRTIVGGLSRRLTPERESVWLDRLLTTITFAVMATLLVGSVWWIGPRFVQQSRALLVRQQNADPQGALQGTLNRTVGAVLLWREYGDPEDDRYQAALKKYQDDGRHGEGWYSQFPDLHAHLKAGFEAQYERVERERIDRETKTSDTAGRQFDQWFLRVKAPALFLQDRQKYLNEWGVRPSDAGNDTTAASPTQNDPLEDDRDEQIRQRILADVKADPITLTDLRREWEQALAARKWSDFQKSPEYAEAFRTFYEQQRTENPAGIPFPYKTYVKLRDAYPLGKEAFSRGLPFDPSSHSRESVAQIHQDFELATRQQLTRAWWSDSPTAAAIREHANTDLPRVAEALGERLEGLVSHLLTLPTQLATALLLTLFICFDMLHLKESVNRLRESRVSHFFAEIGPGLVVFSRLIGRSFAAQALIAVFNTLLSFVLLWGLGVGNELLLCTFVFIGSFIPVLGVLLSGIPITLQALLQPTGSIELALKVIAGILLIHFIEASFLSPRIVGKVSHLHPVMVLVILAIGEHFFGLWGLLLGVPVAVYLIRVVVLKEPIPGIYEPRLESL